MKRILMKVDLKGFDTFVFDLDGTFWWYPNLIEGAKDVYLKLKGLNKKVIFVSNFSYLDRDGIVKIFKRKGLDVRKEQFITSSYVASKVLKNKRVFVIGDGLKREMVKNGVKVVDNDVEAVVIGHDVRYNYKKATEALNFILNGAELYTTARGKVWLMEGKRVAGTGLIVIGLEYCSGKEAILLGKPSEYMIKEVKRVVEGRVIYFGDEFDVDIDFGKKSNFFTVFVKSGIDRDKKPKADLVLNSIKEVEDLI